jgi:plasmid stability protein
MAQVIVRNLDDKIVAALKRNAARHRRSLEGELRAVLTAAARLAPDDKLAISREIRALTPGKRLLADSAPLIRQDRDHR